MTMCHVVFVVLESVVCSHRYIMCRVSQRDKLLTVSLCPILSSLRYPKRLLRISQKVPCYPVVAMLGVVMHKAACIRLHVFSASP